MNLSILILIQIHLRVQKFKFQKALTMQ
ncbi:Protein of unknown function [Bacillus mycoides]|uniref:Uncharacterized protein n=1 Tax=Bacillus mycoides TaxID=1405 RepID=A0A1G4ERA1_BACMY|nr:Protein of unknown function [Bacillus mycoides]